MADTKAMTAAVVSLHFAPAHASHMLAYGKLLREAGFEVSFLIADGYDRVANLTAIGAVISCAGFLRNPGLQKFNIALICNSSIDNRSLAHAMRVRGAAVFYLFHEPESIWNLSGEGWKQLVRFPFSTWCSIATLRSSSGVIVPSEKARVQYERHFEKYNRNVHTMPLLFDDEVGAVRVKQSRHSKKYFGFVGSACKSHNFDSFVDFAKYAIREGSTIPFVIATRVDLSSRLNTDREFARCVNEGGIRLQHNRVLSNDEMNQYYLECFCVWNVYRRSTQSGVLPRAFMAGTPVLASRIGSFPEYVLEGLTGEFVDSSEDTAGILLAAEKMRQEPLAYFDGSRKMFLESFFYKANGNRFAKVLSSVRASDGLLRIA
jgi:glycosyltransferase involved in cell wall biosynthesis